MKLGGQSGSTGQAGYAMAVLLVAMSVMAVLMSVAMPVWSQAARREKEAELVFRGEQYARAIGLFQRRYANAAPPDLDVLVRERFLRKKYRDPITNGDFVPIAAAQPAGGPTPPARGRGAPPPATQPGGSTARGGIIGVTSASTEESIRIYNGATRYDQWRFVYTPRTLAPGAATGTPGAGGRGRGDTTGGGRGQPPTPGNPFRGGTRGAPPPPPGPGR
jgi:type II secretory pathway pseudopilin PulG